MFRLRNDQQTKLAFEFRDKKGAVTAAENATVESSDPSVVAVTANEDGTFNLVAGNVGTAQINASADARLGDGVKTITGSETIEVVPGEAATIKLTFAEPEDQPEVPA